MGDNAPPDPAFHARLPVIQATVQLMPPFQPTDPPLDPPPPVAAPVEPPLPFLLPSRATLPARLGQHHMLHSLLRPIGFVGRRLRLAIPGQQVRRFAKEPPV